MLAAKDETLLGGRDAFLLFNALLNLGDLRTIERAVRVSFAFI